MHHQAFCVYFGNIHSDWSYEFTPYRVNVSARCVMVPQFSEVMLATTRNFTEQFSGVWILIVLGVWSLNLTLEINCLSGLLISFFSVYMAKKWCGTLKVATSIFTYCFIIHCLLPTKRKTIECNENNPRMNWEMALHVSFQWLTLSALMTF